MWKNESACFLWEGLPEARSFECCNKLALEIAQRTKCAWRTCNAKYCTKWVLLSVCKYCFPKVWDMRQLCTAAPKAGVCGRAPNGELNVGLVGGNLTLGC